MSVYDEVSTKKQSFWPYIAISLISAIVGGLVVAFFVPGVDSNSTNGDNAAKNKVVQTSSQNITLDPIPLMEKESAVIEVAEALGPAVVGISNRRAPAQGFSGFNHPSIEGQGTVEQGTGSGVIIDKAGYIVTNNHVVQGASEIMVTLADGREVPGKIVGTDVQTDLAVVKIEEKNLTVASFGNSDNLKVGQLAIAIGNPLGQEFAGTVTTGIISALNRTITMGEQEYKLIQTDAAINPGNSGGALVDAAGQLIGINSAKIQGQEIEGINFAIPISIAKPIIDDLIKHGKVIRPWLGVIFRGETVTKDIAKQYDLPINYGVVIEVTPKGPASSSGLQNNDIIYKIEDREIKEFADLRKGLEGRKPGDSIMSSVLRGKEKLTISVKLGEMPSE